MNPKSIITRPCEPVLGKYERSAEHRVAHTLAAASKIFHLTPEAPAPIVRATTPATPLHDAHQAGYFCFSTTQ